MKRKIRYFHPKGEVMPNGCHIQRGGFLTECRINKTKFLHNGESGRYGGIIVFPFHLKDDGMDEDTLVKDIEQKFFSFTQECWIDCLKHLLACLFSRERESSPKGCRMGHLFTGEYVSETGERYGKNSLCVELNGIKRRQLFSFAKHLALGHGLHNVLVRENERGRINLMDS